MTFFVQEVSHRYPATTATYREISSVLLVGTAAALLGLGTSSIGALPPRGGGLWSTSAGAGVPNTVQAGGMTSDACAESTVHDAVQEHVSTRQQIHELRRLSGLSWDQVAQLFEVSRRSIHFWASGESLSRTNEKRLASLLDVVRSADRGSAAATRSALLSVNDGVSPFDLLVNQHYDVARTVLGTGSPQPRPPRSVLSPEAAAARLPMRPEELLDALQDNVHKELGGVRVVRTVRSTRRATT